MSCKPSQAFLSLALLAGLPSCVSAMEPLQASVCDIQAEPGRFDGKEVVLRGQVYAGVDVTNISDPRCPGEAVQLTVSGRVSAHRDIRSCHRSVPGEGSHSSIPHASDRRACGPARGFRSKVNHCSMFASDGGFI
jgi:hypothetical protein